MKDSRVLIWWNVSKSSGSCEVMQERGEGVSLTRVRDLRQDWVLVLECLSFTQGVLKDERSVE